ncbi:helix-turn-helix transcriptional regulator [Kaistia defluvii]|uniref:helix-turn-helix domain-containing protein n=1 Tax=Kaistia defluvii TaxID=410841 RepID=UPI00225B9507|nr:helix-turn-helix transcriptional regulator [Kaistia defluvii]MCX5517791.1 helix-turn-helix transcriptional regulator [Kaistia defluvii]
MTQATYVDVIIGRSIRSIRMEKSVSQERLAAELGITFQQIQKYEKAKDRLSVFRLLQIADALEVHPNVIADAVLADLQSESPGQPEH